ncbi:GNAT family N-acetyltransferase [Streptococcus parasuis]|uniref:GNAT family N-acetyltransferase n=1 Tax=Streptococcus parasuis TaxID=1501662 RepID=UPI001C1FDBB7|nr:GNAT family N-acetyltransferase [Streptococcus parasuis]QWV86303.1 GNAT family N-acetyltransferase [Streptococcus parasuis]
MKIKTVNEQTLSIWASFAGQVWRTNEQELIEKFRNNKFPYEFLYFSSSEEPIAWISLSLRHDYVEGCQNSPTAYLEGIFIIPDYRSQGIADKLLSFAISWAENRGISQLASDAEFDNQLSQSFHVKYGFREVGRTVHYVLELK